MDRYQCFSTTFWPVERSVSVPRKHRGRRRGRTEPRSGGVVLASIEPPRRVDLPFECSFQNTRTALILGIRSRTIRPINRDDSANVVASTSPSVQHFSRFPIHYMLRIARTNRDHCFPHDLDRRSRAGVVHEEVTAIQNRNCGWTLDRI